MNMTMDIKIDDVIKKRKSHFLKIQDTIEKINFIHSNISKIESKKNQLDSIAADFNTLQHNAININFTEIYKLLDENKGSFSKLLEKINRNTLNIGVVGRMRMGKSTFLRTISGLTNREIPADNLGACTSVQSNIYHYDGDTYADIYLHSEKSFLGQVIHPYYEKLNFNNLPENLSIFKSTPLPRENSSKSEYISIYNNLRNYHVNIGEYLDLLGDEKRAIRVGIEEVKKYVSNYNYGDPTKKFYDHLAVEKVEIFCRFPEVKIKKVGLVDMPGLGDTKLGDEERMIHALGEDIDFILFIRKPADHGDQWKEDDSKLYDIVLNVLSDKIPVKECSALILNKTEHNNEQCNLLESTAKEHGITVDKIIKANCTDPNEANNILKYVIEYLTLNLERLDNLHISSAYKLLEDSFHTIKKELIENLSIHQLNESDKIIENKKRITIDNLFKEIEDFREKSRELFFENINDDASKKFTIKINELINKCNNAILISNEKDLENRSKSRGINVVYFDELHRMRTEILKNFNQLDDFIDDSTKTVKKNLEEIFTKNNIGSFIYIKNNCFEDTLSYAFNFILNFEIKYYGFAQLKIWTSIFHIFPPEPLNPLTINSPEAIKDDLQQKYSEAINKIRINLDSLHKEIKHAQLSMIEEFSDHITRSLNIRDEWGRFLSKNMKDIYPDISKIEQQKIISEEIIFLLNETNNIYLIFKN